MSDLSELLATLAGTAAISLADGEVSSDERRDLARLAIEALAPTVDADPFTRLAQLVLEVLRGDSTPKHVFPEVLRLGLQMADLGNDNLETLGALAVDAISTGGLNTGDATDLVMTSLQVLAPNMDAADRFLLDALVETIQDSIDAAEDGLTWNEIRTSIVMGIIEAGRRDSRAA